MKKKNVSRPASQSYRVIELFGQPLTCKIACDTLFVSFLVFYIPIRRTFMLPPCTYTSSYSHTHTHTHTHTYIYIYTSLLPLKQNCPLLIISKALQQSSAMASSSVTSSSSRSVSFSWRILYISFLIFMLCGSSSASRPGKTMMTKSNEASAKSLEILKAYQQKYMMHRDMVFNSLPKGVPIPPSGPAKRHNLEVKNEPGNWEGCSNQHHKIHPDTSLSIVCFGNSSTNMSVIYVYFFSSGLILEG